MRRAVLLFLVLSAVLPSAARAACPDPCPYTGVSMIGERAGGFLRLPEAVAVDAQNRVWVGDGYSHVITRFNQLGQVELTFGIAGSGDGQFGAITGIAIDPADNSVYVVDADNDRIQHFTQDGTFIGMFGDDGSAPGQFDFGGTQEVSYPQQGGIAIGHGKLWVADSGNDRIQTFALSDVSDATPDATLEADFGYGLNLPQGLWVAPDAVYVADDKNNVAKKFDLNTGTLLASYGVGGPASTAPGAFDAPFDVAVDTGGRLFVVDDNNHRIQAWENADPAAPVVIFGGFGRNAGQLEYPRAITVGPDNSVYVASTANGRVDKFTRDGAFLQSFGQDGRATGQFISPGYLSASPDGGLGVPDAEDNRLQQFLPNRAFLVAYGSINIGPPGPEHVHRPQGIAFDSGFNAYVADTDNSRLVKRGFYGTVLSVWGGPGTNAGQFDHPQGIAVDAAGRMFVADTRNDRVQRIEPSGQPGQLYGDPDLQSPRAVAISPYNGRLYVTSSKSGKPRVFVFDTETGQKVDAFGSSGTADGRFTIPGGIAVDAAGDVYVTDRSQDRVQRFSATGAFEAKWGNEGTGPGEFSQPAGVTVGCDGVVSVADEENNRVQRFTVPGTPTTPCQATPPAPAPPPPPVPETPIPAPKPKPPTPKLALSLKTKQVTKALARRTVSFTAVCDRACTLVLSGRLQPKDTKKRPARRLKAVTTKLKAGRRTTIALKLTKTDVKVLKRALGRHTRLRLSISARATATGAKSATLSRTVSATR